MGASQMGCFRPDETLCSRNPSSGEAPVDVFARCLVDQAGCNHEDGRQPERDHSSWDQQANVNHQLLGASKNSDSFAMKKALLRGAFVETRRPFLMTPESIPNGPTYVSLRGIGLTALMYCAQAGHLETTQQMLSAGAKANAEDEDGLRALHFAAGSGRLDVCILLIKYAADVGAVDDDGRSAMGMVPELEIVTREQRKRWQEILQPEKEDIKTRKQESEMSSVF